MEQNVEITAPVGSHEAFAAAVRGGADSVYLGVEQLNMRARSSANFTVDDLAVIARKSRRLGIKCYLVLNTIVYDDELLEMQSICHAAKDAGIDAVVVSDIAVIEYVRSLGMSVHISVQANISNIDAVRFYAQYADVMVLARELSLPQVKHIIDSIQAENITGPGGELVRVELFAHGALCVAIAGKCYMSLGVYNASANRGACYQNCRRAYRVIDDHTGEEFVLDNKYVMSPKDLCTISFLDQILDAGVSVLKLEGRGRSADYVYTVVKTYRDAVNCWKDGTFTEERVRDWLKSLKKVFNRGFWEGGYYLGEKMGEWSGVDGNISPVKKVHVGNITNYFARLHVAEVTLSAGELKVGQEVCIIGKSTGAFKMNIQEIRLDRKTVESAGKGAIVSISVGKKVRRNDKVYRLEKRNFGELKGSE